MADVEVSQLSVASVTASDTDVRASQLAVTAVFNYPSQAMRSSQLQVTAVTEDTPPIRASQLSVIAVVRSTPDDPLVRAWTFTLDDHDFYVLRLGNSSTFVYDTYSEQWVDWLSPNRSNWRPNTGINWVGGTQNEPTYGSNILVGDDTYGLVYFLDPTQVYDDHPVEDNDDPMYFERIAMGQMSVTGRSVVPCYVSYLTANPGDPAYTGAGVTLYTSDNNGQSFNNHGLIAVTSSQYTPPQLTWYSLGQITAPGRLFKIVDDGAVTRIDSLDMNDDG